MTNDLECAVLGCDDPGKVSINLPCGWVKFCMSHVEQLHEGIDATKNYEHEGYVVEGTPHNDRPLGDDHGTG